MICFLRWVALAAVALTAAACASNQGAPSRGVAIEDDLERVRFLSEPSVADFYTRDLHTQAALRNQIVTARMYIADVAYSQYEINLTKEMQREGFLATAASLGLTTSATLVPVAHTKTLLSALATGVTGLDQAYNEKALLSNSMQALQMQMRADRKTQAGVIYAKMFRNGGSGTRSVTPIAEYTLPMALSDAEAYYQAGNLSSALIGLSKTLAVKEENADQAKSDAGPNSAAVSAVKATSAARQSEPVRVISTLSTGRSYVDLRALLFPNGARSPERVAYVSSLFAPKKVAIGVILAEARHDALRQRIYACLAAHLSGSPSPECKEGSLSALVP